MKDSDTILGAPFGKVPGCNIKEKRKLRLQQPFDAVQTLFTNEGFVATQDSSEIVMMPSGHLYVIVSSGNFGLRWSCSGDAADTTRVFQSLQNLLECFPELKRSALGYTAAMSYIESTFM